VVPGRLGWEGDVPEWLWGVVIAELRCRGSVGREDHTARRRGSGMAGVVFRKKAARGARELKFQVSGAIGGAVAIGLERFQRYRRACLTGSRLVRIRSHSGSLISRASGDTG